MESKRTLCLIPTELERRRLLKVGGDWLTAVKPELCGFGPILSAISTTRLLNAGSYDRVLLCGIAGAYVESGLRPGTACYVSCVMLDAVGVFVDGQLRTGQHLGFSPALPDQLELETSASPPGGQQPRQLLTVCTASQDARQAAERYSRFGTALEDMEGYGVAAACHQQGVPLEIVRGISNVAGDRDKTRWRIDAALGAVVEVISTRLR